MPPGLASSLIARMMSVHVAQAIARHSDLDVTLAIHAHTNLVAMREALDRIEWEIG